MSRPPAPLRIDYGEVVDDELGQLEQHVSGLSVPGPTPPRWLALRLLEDEPETLRRVAALPGGDTVIAHARRATGRIRERTGCDPALLIADRRYGWANDLAAEVVSQPTRRPRTDRIDDVLTSRYLGVPIFLALMWLVFTIVTDVADPYIEWIEDLVEGPLSSWASAALGAVGAGDGWVEGLVVGGAVTGVGAVLVFVPVLTILYLALGVLEDSGYMARAAYLMDRVMAPIGLSGKSFLPLLLGFGCNVPGVYATRLLDHRRERVITALLLPFVSCAARLPVYVLLAGVFFPTIRGTVVFVMYLASIATVLVLGAVLDRLLARDAGPRGFVLELPPYRAPSLRVLATTVRLRVRSFVRRAGSVILVCSMAVWLLLAIPAGGAGSFDDVDLEDSAFAATARVVAPTLAPAGLGSWEVTGTLITGLVAKEVMVATFQQVYEVEEPEGDEDDDVDLGGDLREAGIGLLAATRDAALAIPGMVGIDLLDDDEEDTSSLTAPLRGGLDDSSGGRAGLAAAALLAFVLLYVPCAATVAAIRQELGGRWALVSVGASLTVAWLAATAVFQVGRLLGLG